MGGVGDMSNSLIIGNEKRHHKMGSIDEEKINEFKNNSRRIIIHTERPISSIDKKVIHSIESKFKNNGFLIEIGESTIDFYLKAIDFESFKEYTFHLLSIYEDPKNLNNDLFVQLLDKIEKIGSYGIKNGKRIYVDYNKERKVENRQKKVAQRGFHYYTTNNRFTKEINDLPKEFRNAIKCGDSESELKKLPANCVDLIITSPPYNFGLGYDTSEDGIDWQKYFNKLFAIFDECIRVLKYGGRIIVNIQPLFSDYIPSHHIISNYFMARKMIWKGEILWEKHNYNCKYCAWGSWKSPSGPYLKYTWEFLEIFSKGSLLKPGKQEDIDITAEDFKKWVVAKWAIAPERNMKSYDHPAMFPEELVERALKLFSYKHDVILDPFNGVGTSCVVAARLNRQYIGMDTSTKYCDVARKRLRKIQTKLN
jgi:DNA modification methylase